VNVLIVAGVFQLFFASLTGWVMFLVTDFPERARRLRIVNSRRIRQWHLELLMQGALITALGAALDNPPLWASVLLIVAAWVAPFTFVPLAFKPELGDRPWYLGIDLLSFFAFNISLLVMFLAAVAQR
jgi:hypothetical protein